MTKIEILNLTYQIRQKIDKIAIELAETGVNEKPTMDKASKIHDCFTAIQNIVNEYSIKN